MRNVEETKELLKKLTSFTGVSGDEANIVSGLCDILSQYGDVKVDSLNNITCTFGEGYHILLDAHLDEIGLIVKEITDDGFIKVDKCGGIDRRMLLGYEVTILGKKNINGVISTLPPHLQTSSDEKKVPEFNDIAIDTGYTKLELDEIISLGDRVIFKRNYTELLNDRISASCLDDRCGVAAIILAIEELKDTNCRITALFSSQEEVGTRGAKVGAYDTNVDEAISVDVSFGLSPSCSKDECGELSKGGMIGFSPILDNDISKMLVDVAKKNNIPYQHEIMSGTTGTNADVISITQRGIKTGLISIPERYMHQPVEVIDVNDVISTASLIASYVKEKVGA